MICRDSGCRVWKIPRPVSYSDRKRKDITFLNADIAMLWSIQRRVLHDCKSRLCKSDYEKNRGVFGHTVFFNAFCPRGDHYLLLLNGLFFEVLLIIFVNNILFCFRSHFHSGFIFILLFTFLFRKEERILLQL